MSRTLGIIAALVAASCTSDSVQPPDAGGSGDSSGDDAVLDEGADDGNEAGSSDGDGTVSPAPEIRAAPMAVSPGGRLYLVSDELPRRLVPDIDGRGFGEPTHILQADFPGALYRVPDDMPLGDATLFVRRDGEPESFVEQAIAVEPRRFVDVASDVGLDIVHDPAGSDPECAESHTGLAFGDIDGDGDADLFIGHVGRGGQLMENTGNDADGLPRFVDATEDFGLDGVDGVSMATFVDLEGDGDLDLFVGRLGENRVFDNRRIPDGQTRFVDVTAALGLGVENQRTMGVAFGDYDGDDDLDLYVVNHAYCFPAPDSEVRAGDHLYENVDGTFVDQTPQITGDSTGSVGFSASWVDIDGDIDVDLVIINDDVGGEIGQPNAVWRNDGSDPDGGWVFTDVSEASGVAIPSVNGMGLALGDVNGDGAVDLAFSNIRDNHLQLGSGDGTFVDISEAAGVQRGRLPWNRDSITWAAHLLDHDNDGDLDLYYSGGRIKGTSVIPDALFDNVGEDPPRFDDVTWTSGMAHPGHGKASVLVDLDRDGALDIVTTAWGETLSVYHNRAAGQHHWLAVDLVGRGGNREAVGALVELTAGPQVQTCFMTNRPALGGGGETTCHFGLGGLDVVDALRVRWPDGQWQTQPAPTVDQRIVIEQP